ncbi:MAG: DoxX family protein [Gemmatimonadetes bacterium]|nr:DoxX family protein [Gemmatimonadota bacterium]
MTEMLGRLEPVAHNALRIVIGFLFWSHGAQKLFGWLGGEPVELMSRFGVAGVLEFFGGALIVLGLFTQPVAFVLSGEMAVAYFWMHVPRGDSLWPWVNRGEVAAVYCFVFLFLAASGGGSFSLEGLMKRKTTDH